VSEGLEFFLMFKKIQLPRVKQLTRYNDAYLTFKFMKVLAIYSIITCPL